MKANMLWNKFIEKHQEHKGRSYDAWSYGVQKDELAELTREGIKTATASAYDLYQVDNDPLPQMGEFSVVLGSKDNAVCIIRTTKVTVLPFSEVTAEHAFKEGEGDRSLTAWRKEHESLFTQWLKEENLEFNEDSAVVCEEFEVVYR